MPELNDRDERPPPDWPVCRYHDINGCIGIQIGTTACCLAHLEDQDPEEFKAFLTSLGPGASLDLRGTQLSSDLLDQLLGALRAERQEPPTIGPTRFDQVQFSGSVRLDGVQFRADASFEEAYFSEDAWFGAAQFSTDAWFSGAQFNGDAWFSGVQFGRDARFEEARFSGDAWFDEAHFARTTMFIGAQVARRAEFSGAEFAVTTMLGPLRADLLSLDRAHFLSSVIIEIAASHLSMMWAKFDQEAAVQVRYADVLLDGAAFSKPASLAFAETPFLPPPSSTDGQPGSEPQRSGFEGFTLDETPLRREGSQPRPRLLSLQRVDVTNLVLSDLDLTWCLFRGAHNLDRLRIEGPKHFTTTPRGWRWTERRTLAEEHMWRYTRRPRPAEWWN
jgi:uncharacterized protein YjbI with pentapeptide repeats